MDRMNWKKVLTATVVVAGLAIAAACSSTTVVSDAGGGTNCGTGSTQCGDTCTVVARDPQNCGTCGKACAMGEVCSQGMCASSCGGGTTKCASECVDTKTDGRNCGSCGKACAAGEVCMAGTCATSCAMGTTKCGQSCVNSQTDRTNCGACGKTCQAGEICNAGKCEVSCGSNLTKCTPVLDGGVPDGGSGDVCVDTQNDPLNCGGCNMPCKQNELCSAGKCTFVSQPCSKVAEAYCKSLGMGWAVPQNGQAAGGRLYCTKNNVGIGSDCNTCTDYQMIVWANAAKPAFCTNFTYSTQAGKVYAGHNPCTCGDNLIPCGNWNMMNCYPD